MDDDADVFGPLLGLEEAFTSKGRKVGYEDGRVSGSQDARAFGVGKGYDVGEEIGFYLGVALMCRRLGLSAQKPKAAAAANAVLAIAEALPVRAPDDLDWILGSPCVQPHCLPGSIGISE